MICKKLNCENRIPVRKQNLGMVYCSADCAPLGHYGKERVAGGEITTHELARKLGVAVGYVQAMHAGAKIKARRTVDGKGYYCEGEVRIALTKQGRKFDNDGKLVPLRPGANPAFQLIYGNRERQTA